MQWIPGRFSPPKRPGYEAREGSVKFDAALRILQRHAMSRGCSCHAFLYHMAARAFSRMHTRRRFRDHAKRYAMPRGCSYNAFFTTWLLVLFRARVNKDCGYGVILVGREILAVVAKQLKDVSVLRRLLFAASFLPSEMLNLWEIAVEFATAGKIQCNSIDADTAAALIENISTFDKKAFDTKILFWNFQLGLQHKVASPSRLE